MNPDRSRVAELLIAHLAREEAACLSLLRCAERKRAAIVANDLPDLRTASDAESAAVGEIARLRGVRERLVSGLVRAAGLPGGGIRALCADLVDEHPEVGDRLDRLRGIARRTEVANLGNQSLLRNALAIVEGLLESVVGAEPTSGVYGAAAPAGTRGGGLLDTRA